MNMDKHRLESILIKLQRHSKNRAIAFVKLVKKKQEQGYQALASWVFNRIINVTSFVLLYLLSIPVAVMILGIRPFVKIRLIALISRGIGHFSMNTELMLCDFEMRMIEDERHINLFYTRGAISNVALYNMWKRTIRIVPFQIIWYQIDKLLLCLLGNRYKNDQIKIFETPAGGQDIHGYIKKLKPHLSFTQDEVEKGARLLNLLGIKQNAKIVCLLVRDEQYLNESYPDVDWSYHSYRNSDIENYKMAALWLAERGYYVLRMGKLVSKAFKVDHPNVIDYANHKLRSDFMDIYLSAHCEFFISTGTGIDGVAAIFRRPLLLVNYAECYLPYIFVSDIFLPKKIVDLKADQHLSFFEMMVLFNKLLTKKSVAEILHEQKLAFVENNPQEILDVVQEMVLYQNKPRRSFSEDEILQKLFWDKYKQYVMGSNINFHKLTTRISSKYLRNANFNLERVN